MSVTRTLKTKEIEYPSADGKPMAETELHGEWMIRNTRHFKESRKTNGPKRSNGAH